MAIVVRLDGVAASGTPLAKDLGGAGRAHRLTIKNAGAAPLGAVDVQLGPDQQNRASLDSTTFASLGAGATKSILIPSPVDAIAVVMGTAATTVDIALTSEAG